MLPALQFHAVMDRFLDQLGLSSPGESAHTYRLTFGTEDPLFIVAQGAHWLKIQTRAGQLEQGQADQAALALLSLAPTTDLGPSLSLHLDRTSGSVWVSICLPLSASDPDQLIAAVQAVRRHRRAAVQALGRKPAALPSGLATHRLATRLGMAT